MTIGKLRSRSLWLKGENTTNIHTRGTVHGGSLGQRKNGWQSKLLWKCLADGAVNTAYEAGEGAQKKAAEEQAKREAEGEVLMKRKADRDAKEETKRRLAAEKKRKQAAEDPPFGIGVFFYTGCVCQQRL